ncbi:globoside alpha-1,3-N-acetylgalactosaminyltransferase 1-like [Electrophorus electricus]|uniref:globoside alpha-1,3-N-acetylgalactosaminyltransferase 1-like n=1 Tax=Electrophorus electricus TaxID=8005 RepID=UPI0015CF9E8D|nr:globoside alpha-1,3-N-acetylgalactosaminyltransferase 1-like [Electrophorus electricus]
MRLLQNSHLFVLSLVGLLLVGCIYFGYTSAWFRYAGSRSGVADRLSYKQPSILNGRKDVITVTPWLAPVVWEGTFHTTLIDAIYKMQNITVATTVFALGKYVQFLKDFLESAEKHYMQGYRVHYYIFTDQPEAVPTVTLGASRSLTTLKIPSSNRWQEITLHRMERLEKLIETQLTNEVDYIFSLDVDTKFYGHWGVETLGDIVAVIHPGYYSTPRDDFPYERRSESQAYIPYGKGDFYYGGAVIGGRVEKVHKLAKTCRMQLDVDKANSIEAAWQEESHLNKYFLYNKPTKILSPEYLWQDTKYITPDIKIIRFSQVIKNYAKVRPNP